jgi:hypothetical protein
MPVRRDLINRTRILATNARNSAEDMTSTIYEGGALKVGARAGRCSERGDYRLARTTRDGSEAVRQAR